jgi:hypothetical protein
MVINGLGACATGVIAIEAAATKFIYGAWIVLVLMPFLVLLMRGIRHHYQRVEEQLALPPTDGPVSLASRPKLVLVPVPGLNKAVIETLRYARSLSDDVTAVHLTDTLEHARRIREEWERRQIDIPLVIIEAPYRGFVAPLMNYIDSLAAQYPDKQMTIVLPEFVPQHWWEHVLHNQSALRLKAALLFRPDTVVIDVPYHIRHEAAPAGR